MPLTKYTVCAAYLLAVALVGAVGMILSAYARGYPPEAANVGRIFTAAAASGALAVSSKGVLSGPRL